ncbi:hypothetical protein D3C81_1415450 [compost metagenome]
MRHHRDQEHAQGNRRHGGDDEHQLQRFTDAKDVDADKDDVEGQVDHPAANAEQRLTIGTDEHGNRGRGDGVFDQDCRAGQKPAPGPERTAGKAVAATGGGNHRRQFCQGEAHAQVHGGHQQGGEEHATPAALGQAEVPAGVVAGNHIGNAQAYQQDPACGTFFQFTLLEVIVADFFEVNRGACRHAAGLIAWHRVHLFFLSSPASAGSCGDGLAGSEPERSRAGTALFAG